MRFSLFLCVFAKNWVSQTVAGKGFTNRLIPVNSSAFSHSSDIRRESMSLLKSSNWLTRSRPQVIQRTATEALFLAAWDILSRSLQTSLEKAVRGTFLATSCPEAIETVPFSHRSGHSTGHRVWIAGSKPPVLRRPETDKRLTTGLCNSNQTSESIPNIVDVVLSGNCLNQERTKSVRSILGHSNHLQSPEPIAWQRFTNSLVFDNQTKLDYSSPQNVRPTPSTASKCCLRTRCRTLCPEGQKTPPFRRSPDIPRQKPILRPQFATSNVG